MPSMAPSFNAPNTSGHATGVGFAGRILNAACSSFDPVTRIFRPFTSSGLRISWLTLLDISSQRGAGEVKRHMQFFFSELARTPRANSGLKTSFQ